MTNTGERVIESAEQECAPKNAVCAENGRFPTRLLVTSLSEDKSGCVGGKWFGDIRDWKHPGMYVSVHSKPELEAALAKLDGSSAADRIQELEAELVKLNRALTEEISCRVAWLEEAQKLRAQLSGVRSGTHCIVPVEQEQRIAELEGALQGIIDWADFVLKNPQEFEAHGVRNLEGPMFDKARELLFPTTQA